MDRRNAVADAALAVLARDGLRGLTHRAVDTEAGLPAGSCSNVFRTRAHLVTGVSERAIERLTPDDQTLAEQAAIAPSRDQLVQLMIDLVNRLRAEPSLQLALLELRIESTRRPELVDPLTSVVRSSFDADVAFHERAGLPGGADAVMLLHLAIGGLVTNLLTLPDALPLGDVPALIATLVDRLIYHAGM